MKTKWLTYVKKVLLAMAACIFVLLGGAALVALLIAGEAVKPEYADYLLPVVILLATIVSCAVANAQSDSAVYINVGIGVFSVLLVTFAGSIVLNAGADRNILGTILMTAAGAALFMMLKLKKKDGRIGNAKITKMVNLYKNQTR